MPEGTVVRTKRDGIIAITDGVNTYTVAYEPGDFTFDVPLETVLRFLDRGVIPATPSIRKGDDQPCTFSWSVYLRDLVDAAFATLLDTAVQFSGGYVDGNWTSTIGNASDVTTWTVNWTLEGSDFGGSDVTLSFPYSWLRASAAEGDPDTVNISGTSEVLRPTFA